MNRHFPRCGLAACVALATAACVGDSPTASRDDALRPAAALQTIYHRITLFVTNANGGPAQGIVATATNTLTGDYYLKKTTTAGQTLFELPEGSYLIHARNLEDFGPAVPLKLSLAPLPMGTGLLATQNTQGQNNVGVLFDPGAPGGAVMLEPAAYSRLTANPALVLTGPSTRQTINLQFLAGAGVTCMFEDDTGAPLPFPAARNVFLILPHGSGPLPPLPAAVSGLGLPRALLVGATTVPAGSNVCSLQGLPSGMTKILETSAISVQGKEKIFVQSLDATPTGGQTTLIAEPRRSNLGYVVDPWGDHLATGDIGLVTHGWELTGIERRITSDVFAVNARVRGARPYKLVVTWRGPGGELVTGEAVARCSAQTCTLDSTTPNLAGKVVVIGVMQAGPGGPEGNLLWEITLPSGVGELDLYVIAGESDRAPDQGTAHSTKQGNSNTWVIPGD